MTGTLWRARAADCGGGEWCARWKDKRAARRQAKRWVKQRADVWIESSAGQTEVISEPEPAVAFSEDDPFAARWTAVR